MKQLLHTFKIFTILAFILGFTIQCSEDITDFSHAGVIKGVAVKYETNEPLANVKITTGPTTSTVFTAEDGSFIIQDVPMGDYSVKAELKGYMMEINPANIVETNQTVSIVFEMKDDNTLNSPPSPPVLIYPTDNAIDQSQNITLVWNSVDPDGDDLTYKLIVRNNRDDVVVEVEDLEEITYLLENLEFNTSYFWQVVVNDGINEDVYSQVFKFTTASIPQNRFHFVRFDGENDVVYSSDELGNAFKLTRESVNSFRPRKNNAGNLVSFLRNTNGNVHLYTSKSDGNEPFKVTQIPLAGFNNNELDYAWNYNGSQLIYPNYNKLYKVNKDGTGTELVHTTADGNIITECAWSSDGSKIVLKTNNLEGYNAKIYIIDLMGNTIKTILENVNGAAGGLDISTDGSKILFTHDISGYQSPNYRQLSTHIFIYDLNTDTMSDISGLSNIPNGFIDIDPRFSPNDAEVIFTHTSNDGLSRKDVYKISMQADDNGHYTRSLLFENASMPDWE